jgi:hypothetical protein
LVRRAGVLLLDDFRDAYKEIDSRYGLSLASGRLLPMKSAKCFARSVRSKRLASSVTQKEEARKHPKINRRSKCSAFQVGRGFVVNGNRWLSAQADNCSEVMDKKL